jgi:two-component system NtrC family response regulator
MVAGSEERSEAFAALRGACSGMRALRERILRVAACDVPVLVRGETGTGKDLVARAIHELGPRRAAPMVPVNCAGLSAELVESELFGHERGAFTGALQSRGGKIAAAHRGTLFLDEIGDLPLPLQGRLLRFLQSGEVQRVGRDTPLRVDVRVVAATNVDLEAGVARGTFRADLFHRLNCVELVAPPLRERGDDVIRLAEHILARVAAESGRRLAGFTPEAERALRSRAWPGNVRELENAVRGAVVFADGPLVDARDLPRETASCQPRDALRAFAVARDLTPGLIERCGGNLSRVARELGVSRPTLYKRLRSLNVDVDSVRRAGAASYC